MTSTLRPPLRLDDAAASAESCITPQNYSYMQQYVYEKSGIVLDLDKHYLLHARLTPILYQRNLETLDALCHHLRTDSIPGLSQQVIDAITTNETLFFRDRTIFDALRDKILPALLEARKSGRLLRIWSAAASSGQEAYSLAMLLLDMQVDPSGIEILGTDLSEKVLAKARQGRYPQFEISRGLPSRLLVRYFTSSGTYWQISDAVRRMVRFEQFDLRSNMARLGNFDLVLCRNVLIYFDQQTKDKILSSISRVLQPDGVLFLGCAESLNGSQSFFERHQHEQSSYYRLRQK